MLIKAWIFVTAYMWADLLFNLIEAAYRHW